AARFSSAHFPSSFFPHNAIPGGLRVEGRIPESVRDTLAARGHAIILEDDWVAGDVLCIRVDPRTGVLHGGADPRGEVSRRLPARGIVERDERGRYRVTEQAAVVQSHVRAWSRVEERTTAWNGGWIGVHTGALKRSDRRAARRRRRAFDFLGFRALDPGLWIRPDNLRGGVAEVRRQLEALGLDAAAIVFALGALDDATEARA